jgi:hypothetical protein
MPATNGFRRLIRTTFAFGLLAAGLQAQTRWRGGGVEITLTGSKVTRITVSGRQLAVSPAPFVALREVAVGKADFVPGALTSGPEGTLRATFAGLGVVAEITPHGEGGRLALSARVTGKPGAARGYLLRFSLPFDALGWQWHDDMQTAREVTAGNRYQNTRPLRAFADMPEWEGKGKLEFGHSNRNFCTVLTGPVGLCLAMPLDRPCLSRTAYDADTQRLDLVFDFALSPDSRFPNQAEFQFLLYGCDPEWGFRDALQGYYKQFPQWFKRYIRRQGQWMAFTRLSSIDNADEFGFALQEGAPEVDYDDKLDVISAIYFTHAGMGAKIPGHDPEKDPLPSHEIQVKAVEAAFKRRTKQEGVFAAVGLHDREGKLAVAKWSVYAHLIAQFNLDPELPYGKWTLEQAIRRTEQAKARNGAVLDGFYYDGLTTGVNYRRDHFRTAGAPVLWDPFAKRPFIYNFFSSCEFSRAAAELLRPRGQITMMNGALGSSFYVAPWLDVLGAETGLRIPRESFNYIRTVIHRKPFMTLLKGNYEQRIGHAEMELFMKRCLAYGVFPGFFDWPPSGLGPGGRYWDHAAYFERDRELFRKYQPLCLTLADAGWSPVTHALGSSASVPVERYGPDADGVVYLSLLNETARSQETVLRVDAAALGLADGVQALELVGSAPIPLVREGKFLTARLQLPPDGVMALQLAAPRQVAGWRVQQAAEIAKAGVRMLGVDRDKPARPVHWLPSGKARLVAENGSRHAVLGNGSGNVRQWAMLFQSEPAALTLRARVRARDLKAKTPNAAAIRCRIAWTTKSFSHYEWRDFPLPTGTYDWQDVSFTIQSDQPLRAVDVRPTLGGGTSGELWVSKVSLSDAEGGERLLDPAFEQWYLPLPTGVRPVVEDSYARLSTLLSNTQASEGEILAGLALCTRLESGIRAAKAENGGRRALRDVVALRHHLGYAFLARKGGTPPVLRVPETVIPGDAIQPQTSDGEGTWSFELAGKPARPPFAVPADTAPGTVLPVQATCSLGNGKQAVRFTMARTVRVVEPVSLELTPKGMDLATGTSRVQVLVRNNGRRQLSGQLTGVAPAGWIVTVPAIPAIAAGGSTTVSASLAPKGKGTVASVPVTFVAQVGAIRSERTLDVLYLPPGANRIPNPSFEAGMGRWSAYPKIKPEIVPGGRSGAALQLQSTVPAQAGVHHSVVLKQKAPCALFLQAFAQTEDVSGSKGRGFSLYVDLYHTDGTASYGHTYSFDPGETGWQLGTLYIEPRKPVANANIYLLFRQRTGTVRYDDILLVEDARRKGNLAPTAKVSVDSSYSKYTAEPLTDGIIEPGDRHWSEQAWASADEVKAHHVQLDFPAPVQVRRVVVHWSRDAGVMRTSRQLRVESAAGVLWQADALAKSPLTEIILKTPATVKSLRLVQPAGGGPEERPGLFWIREIEVFGDPQPPQP